MPLAEGSAVVSLLLRRREPDATFLKFRRRFKESLNAVINLLDVRAVSLLRAFHIFQFSGEILVRG
jgi:hypothetical protein